jgi:hypothetical protein
MKNEWINFVRQFAKENNLSYSQAIKEAGPAYRSIKKGGKSSLTGKGYGDLPDELVGKIGSYLDNNSFDNLLNTNTETRNKYTRDELNRREDIVEGEYARLTYVAGHLLRMYHQVMMNFMNTNNSDTFRQYYDNVIVLLHRLAKLQNDQLLSEQKRASARRVVEELQTIVTYMTRMIRRNRE